VAVTLLAAIQRPTQKAMECQCCARVTHAGLRVGGKPLEAWLAFACTAHAAGLVAPRELSTAGYWLRWPRYRPTEVTTDRAPAYPRVLDEVVPEAWHVVEQYANLTRSKPITAG
jgi:hypothetical protein